MRKITSDDYVPPKTLREYVRRLHVESRGNLTAAYEKLERAQDEVNAAQCSFIRLPRGLESKMNDHQLVKFLKENGVFVPPHLIRSKSWKKNRKSS